MLIPTLNGWSAGEKVTASKLTTQTKTAIENAVYYKPFCEMYATSNSQSLSQYAWTKINLGGVVEDSDNMASTSTSEIVIKTAGRYRILGQCGFNANTGYRTVGINKNAAGIAATTISNVNDLTRLQASRTVRLAVNDRLTLVYYGPAITTDTGGGTGGIWLSAEWVSL